MNEGLKILLSCAAILFGFIAVMAIPIEGSALYSCNNYENITGKQTKYKFFDSCYVKTQAGWQRWDEYTNRSVASEGLTND